MSLKELITQEPTILKMIGKMMTKDQYYQHLEQENLKLKQEKCENLHEVLMTAQNKADRKFEILEEDYTQLFNKFDALKQENEKIKFENSAFIDANEGLAEKNKKLQEEIAELKEKEPITYHKLSNEDTAERVKEGDRRFCIVKGLKEMYEKEKDDEEFEYVGRGDETLDRWVEDNYGEDMDWEFGGREKTGQGLYCHAKVGDDYGDWEIGIVIVPKEYEVLCPSGRGGGFQQDIGECECGGYFEECKTCGDPHKCQHCGLCAGI